MFRRIVWPGRIFLLALQARPPAGAGEPGGRLAGHPAATAWPVAPAAARAVSAVNGM